MLFKSNQLKRSAIIRLHTAVLAKRFQDSLVVTKWQQHITVPTTDIFFFLKAPERTKCLSAPPVGEEDKSGRMI